MGLLRNYYRAYGKSTRTPYVIRQMLAYTFYYGIKYGFFLKSQKDFLSQFGLDKKVFNDWGIYPLKIYESEKYLHPENPSSYMGVKHGELGEAIRELAYQAGAYKEFYDIFWGSGTASTAIPYEKSRKYFCNEFDNNLSTI